MKDMGEACLILGVKIIRKDDSIISFQECRFGKLLRKFGHFDWKPMSTPFDSDTKLKKNKGYHVAQSDYVKLLEVYYI